MDPKSTAQNNPDTKAKPGSKSLQVLEALKGISDPKFGENIVKLGYVKHLSIQADVVKFEIILPEDTGLDGKGLEQSINNVFKELEWITEAQFGVLEGGPVPEPMHAPAAPAAPAAPVQQPGHRPLGGVAPGETLPDVKHVIAVGSGKGGVGKSTVSVNLALALTALGYKVGLMDADVYGPSVPLMLGVTGEPQVNEKEKLLPLEHSGLKIMSMGFLMAPDQAVVWRGPMIHGVIKQFLTDVDWGELDYLVVDLPPGTGDAPLSLIQALPLTASVVVTTPQEVAASVAQKSMAMFEKMGIRILGVIENMSYFDCPDNDKVYYIFGQGGGKKLAEAHDIPLLGEIPINVQMRQGGDTGKPVMLENPDGELAKKFLAIAEHIAKEVA